MINEELERIGKIIVNSAYKVHIELGPGLLEKIYEACLAYEIRKAELDVKRQVELPVIYDGKNLNENLRLDLLVEDLVIVEIKSVDKVNPVWNA